ncbi:MAG: prolyl-tRNA synthetase associated domain-containing protein [Bacteroidales bacterium]|nr:prolyl-tRNA synthetase associated domain-containing protein [Bacteroidales bacterium]MDD4656536.1 prolyl-tRNA synthetase associated domain-containing protein [Bacteroidales bacterium]
MTSTKEFSLQYKSLIDQTALQKIEEVTNYLKELAISYQIWYHPPLPTIEEALKYWEEMPGTHCKNLFFRNHKGNRHYLVLFECHQTLDIRSLEQRLKQGKLTFASQKRMDKYLGVTAGSVTPFGLINDKEQHVKVFIDNQLKDVSEISFHPNDNRASLVLANSDFKKYLESLGNPVEYI